MDFKTKQLNEPKRKWIQGFAGYLVGSVKEDEK